MLLKTQYNSLTKLSLYRVVALAPAVAVSDLMSKALAMSICFVLIITLSEFLAALLDRAVPVKLRAVSYLLITTSVVTVVTLAARALVPAAAVSLGVYLPVLAVSCAVIMRIETYAVKSSPLAAALDGIVTGAAFTGVMMGMSLIREILGTGKLFAGPDGNGGLVLFSAPPVAFFATSGGALLLLAVGGGLLAYIRNKKENAAGGTASELI